MKETGIVRKLDNLGRLVIPKEIRRCMRIKEGSPIEFGLLPTGEIVLNKYSLVSQISDYAEDFSDTLGEIFNCIIYIGDRDKIISTYGASKKNSLGVKLSNEVLDIIDNNTCYISSSNESTTIVPILEDDKNTYTSQIIYPIKIQGDIEGVIILCDCKNQVNFDTSHALTLRVVARFLSRQME